VLPLTRDATDTVDRGQHGTVLIGHKHGHENTQTPVNHDECTIHQTQHDDQYLPRPGCSYVPNPLLCTIDIMNVVFCARISRHPTHPRSCRETSVGNRTCQHCSVSHRVPAHNSLDLIYLESPWMPDFPLLSRTRVNTQGPLPRPTSSNHPHAAVSAFFPRFSSPPTIPPRIKQSIFFFLVDFSGFIKGIRSTHGIPRTSFAFLLQELRISDARSSDTFWKVANFPPKPITNQGTA